MKLVAKQDVWWWKVIGWVFPRVFHLTWTTIGDTVYYPPYVEDPKLPQYKYVLVHEALHMIQQAKTWLPWWIFCYMFLPLPLFFSWYRWKAEREAYLTELEAGAPIDAIVEVIWNDYGYCWPKKWMTVWFEKELERFRADHGVIS